MYLRYSKKFTVSLRALGDDKRTVVHAIEAFQENPFDPSLRNHSLTGKISGKRALVVDHDLRVIFAERGNYRDVI